MKKFTVSILIAVLTTVPASAGFSAFPCNVETSGPACPSAVCCCRPLKTSGTENLNGQPCCGQEGPFADRAFNPIRGIYNSNNNASDIVMAPFVEDIVLVGTHKPSFAEKIFLRDNIFREHLFLLNTSFLF